MKQTQRHDAIIELVKKQGYVSTEELVEQFAVSPQTIRRDLNDLAEQKMILRHHGGAALPSSSVNTSWHDRKATQTQEKERIARKVASQIPDGATLFIDIGTTPEAVAHALFGDCAISGKLPWQIPATMDQVMLQRGWSITICASSPTTLMWPPR